MIERDELFDRAAVVIREAGNASVSTLQRNMGLGYTRAARLLDQLEEAGIVGPRKGAAPREIYTAAEVEELKLARAAGGEAVRL